MVPATPSHGTLSPLPGRPQVTTGVRGPAVSRVLTDVLRTAYRMLHDLLGSLFSRTGMEVAQDCVTDVDSRKAERSAKVDPHTNPKEDGQFKAIESSYVVSHRVIGSRAKKLLRRKRK